MNLSNTQLLQLAIKASQNSDWQQAIEYNQEMLAQDPDNIGTLNRLAFCQMQNGESKQAKKIYDQVLSLEPHNTIAQKYLELLKHKSGNFVPPPVGMPEDFIEEPGKTKTLTLQKLADPEALQRTAVGAPCTLVIKKHRIDVLAKTNNSYLGCLPDDIAFRLQKLIKIGNTYAVFVRSVNKKSCVIFVKELTRSDQSLGPSFPVNSPSLMSLNQDDVLLDEAPLDIRETGNEENEAEAEESEDQNEA